MGPSPGVNWRAFSGVAILESPAHFSIPRRFSSDPSRCSVGLLAALRSHENHIQAFRKPGILRWRARRRHGHLCKLDPLLATPIQEALYDYRSEEHTSELQS